MAFALPSDVDRRPVAIDGAGTLGRRIAAVYAAGGSDVRVFDMSGEQREAARAYVDEHVGEMQTALDLDPKRRGAVQTAGSLDEAVAGAWMVIEAACRRQDRGLRGARPARRARRDLVQQLLIASDQPGD